MANLPTFLQVLLWFSLAPWTIVEGQDSEEWIRVVIGFNSPVQQEAYMNETLAHVGLATRSSNPNNNQRAYQYRRSNAMAMDIPASQLDSLALDPRVSYVQRDSRFQLYQRTEEVIPYGIELVQGTSTIIPPPAYSSGNCGDPNSFKVCVVDSGLLVDHPDIPFDLTGANIIGQEFGIESVWYRPSAASSHGTHVTGTILAQGNNGFGVVGVVPDPLGICLLVARTFDERSDQDASVITEAVEWCADNGARIINLSLGTTTPLSQSDTQVYENLFNTENVLLIAAAGNRGDNTFSFPASLPVVMSVAATNENLNRAIFSQYNAQVDISAPGVRTLSTISSNGAILTTPNIFIDSVMMFFSQDTPDILLNVPLEMVDCEKGFDICLDATSKACIIEREKSFFWEKALNCQKGGGLVAFIYNNVDGPYGGSLIRNDTGVTIPVFAVSRADGFLMLDNLNTSRISLLVASPSYGYLDGTSMAAPLVTGVATKIWAARPSCTNLQIREALENSATDLGPTGWDESFGFGLVQADAAYQYVVTNFAPPCGYKDSAPNYSLTAMCLPIYANCTSNDECCSGDCAPAVVDGPTMCRIPTQDNTKSMVRSPARGGATGGLRNWDRRHHHRRHRGRRQLDQDDHPQVASGSSTDNVQRQEPSRSEQLQQVENIHDMHTHTPSTFERFER